MIDVKLQSQFMTSIVIWRKRAFPYGSLSKACLVSLLRVKYNEVIIKVFLRRTKSMVVHLFGLGCVGGVVSSELKKKVYCHLHAPHYVSNGSTSSNRHGLLQG